jgi:hypothetical protein
MDYIIQGVQITNPTFDVYTDGDIGEFTTVKTNIIFSGGRIDAYLIGAMPKNENVNAWATIQLATYEVP